MGRDGAGVDGSRRELLRRVATGFLVVTYAIGAPMTAFLEHRDAVFSQRFGYPPELIYLVCTLQLVACIGLLLRPLVFWAALGLTAVTLGAMVSHFRIGSPVTALPALVYTGIQIWVALEARRDVS